MIRRGKEKIVATDEVELQGLDVLVLRGNAESLARAEQRLLKS
jgi:monovalent cation:H+ antiporter-2, CPA2 family